MAALNYPFRFPENSPPPIGGRGNFGKTPAFPNFPVSGISGSQRPSKETEEIARDLRLVATWWAWSQEDLTDFQTWARKNHEDAAAWVRQEALTVRHYVDQLRLANVHEFIRPIRDRSETDPRPRPPHPHP